MVSVAWVLLVSNLISWCFIVQLPGHLVNFIVLFFQLTSGLCLTSQSYPRNMSIPFRSVTAASNCSLWPLILISKDATLCCGNHQIQSPIVTQASKAFSRQSSQGNHKRTRQGVSAKLKSYIYRIHMVHATSSYLPHFLLKATMLYTCVLTSSFRSFYYIIGLWCHIMWHVMWLRYHMLLHCH